MTPTKRLSRRVPAVIRLGLFAVVASVTTSHTSAQFTPGNIMVLRLGNGTTALSSNAAAGTLIEINAATGAATGYSVALPTAATANNGGITFSGTSSSAAHLHRSADGTFLTTIGYDAPVNSAGIEGSLNFTYSRTIARIDASGIANTQRLTDSTFSGGQARSVVSDGTQYWLGGGASSTTDRGVRYVSSGSATTSTRLVNADIRDVNIFNSRLFYTSGNQVFAVTGSPPPTSGAPTTTSIFAGTAVTGFVFLDRDATRGDPSLGGLDTLYVADGTSILKAEFGAGVWTTRGNYDSNQLGTTFSLTGMINGANVDLYATDTTGHLVKITDTSAFENNMVGSDGWSSSFTVGANFTLRGVDFTPTPVPEPGAVLAIAATGLGLAGWVRRRYRGGSV